MDFTEIFDKDTESHGDTDLFLHCKEFQKYLEIYSFLPECPVIDIRFLVLLGKTLLYMVTDDFRIDRKGRVSGSQ